MLLSEAWSACKSCVSSACTSGERRDMAATANGRERRAVMSVKISDNQSKNEDPYRGASGRTKKREKQIIQKSKFCGGCR